MPNRAERRRLARESLKKDIAKPTLNQESLESVSREVMRCIERKKARDEAILAATGPIIQSVYAAVILVMTERYNFTHDQCVELLTEIEDKTLYCLDHQDIVNEAYEKTGIRINFRDGLDRINTK